MAKTITGAQFRDFYHNHWPKGWYVEELPMDIENDIGDFVLRDTDTVDLENCGWAAWEGGNQGKEFLNGEDRDHSLVPMAEFYQRVMERAPKASLMTFKGGEEDLAKLRIYAESIGLSIV